LNEDSMVEGPVRATRKSMNNAKYQRRNMSPPEVKLWNLLRRSPGGVGFRRQHPIGPYTADFYCPAAKLVIEIDGQTHDFTVDRDKMRDAYMRSLGLRILRIPASEVMKDPVSVADGLVRLCGGPSTAQLR
jgi:very-short-patch-repair endonuclease